MKINNIEFKFKLSSDLHHGECFYYTKIEALNKVIKLGWVNYKIEIVKIIK